jgi:hypothetical protein
MADEAPDTRDWKALEMTDLIGRNGRIAVTGEVAFSGTGTTDSLVLHEPQGTNPTILLLDLKVTNSGGIQGHIAGWHTVSYEQKTSGHQYQEVDILYDGKIIERIKVEHPLTVAAAAARKPAKKKPAKKKAAKRKPTKKKAAKKPARKRAKARGKK